MMVDHKLNNTKSSQKNTSSDSPLTRLASVFSDDMKQVNALILKHLKSDVPLIADVAQYLIMAGGKRIRPLLTLASTRLCGDKGTRPYNLAAAVEFIHTATLLHDDVVDDSEERRGQDAAPVVFGNQASVLVGDFLFSRAFQLMVGDGDLNILRVLSDASAIISQGEVMQLQTTGNLQTTIEDYKNVIAAKTAALFAAACEIGPLIAGRDKRESKAMHRYGENLGMAFQMADDVLDYGADGQTLGKDPGDDFREGKITAPIILALNKATEKERAFWQRTLCELDQTDSDLQRAMDILKRHDSLSQTLSLARDYVALAKESLAEISHSDPDLAREMEYLADYALSRRY